MQQETLSVVHRRTLVLAGLGVVDYVTLRSANTLIGALLQQALSSPPP